MSTPPPDLAPPFGPCWKQKPTLRTWPLRYARIEGKSLNVYADERDTKKRGSSITDVTGCTIEQGMESWMLQDDKPKLVLKRADLQGGGSSSFAFASVELRDMFYEALANLAEGRDWYESTASVVLKSNRFSGSTVVEWMWADAGSDMTRGLARRNPLRWTTGTVETIANEMQGLAAAKSRPVDLRIKGTSDMYSFENQADALSWLQQVSEQPEPAVGTRPAEPEPDPQLAASLQPGDRYDSVCGTLDGIPRTPPRIHGDPEPPTESPAEGVQKLIRSASQEELEGIKDVVKAHGLVEKEAKTAGGRMTDDPFIYNEDLDVTDQDRRHGFVDWRECAVNGAHLLGAVASKGKGFEASGAKGYVRRAVWKRCLAVAIKKANQETWSGRDGLTDEMRLFLDLAHPHIVACYGILKEPMAGSAEGSAALPENSIVTERCQTSLQEFLNDGSKWADLTPDEVDLQKYTILSHVSLGLQKLHDMSILHRDIKCNNVLLDGEHTGRECGNCGAAGRWKICDFGEAIVLRSETGDSDPKSTIDRTDTDTAVTSGNASPELLNGVDIGLPSDIYSFGVLMWEVFTRQEAWHWITSPNKAEAISFQVMVENRRPKIPQGLAYECVEKIRRCVCRNPSRRPEAREMNDWLEQCRRKKLMSLKVQGPVRERQVLRLSNQRVASIVDPEACSLCPKNSHCPKGTCQHWSKTGRYSIHPTWFAKREFSGVERMCFNLRLVAESIGEKNLNRSWTEPDRLREDYDSDNESDDESSEVAPHGSGAGGSMECKPPPLGIVFKAKDPDSGQIDNRWPKVKSLKPTQLAAQFNDFIQPDCTLLAVNELVIDEQMKFKDVFPLIQRRPLTLCFSSTEKWTDLRTLEAGKNLSYVAAAALQAGLECVGMVRTKEQSDPSIPGKRDDGDRPLTRLPSELARLREENAQLRAAQQTQLDEQQMTAAGLRKAMDMVKQTRVELQAKDAEIAALKSRLQRFEGEPPL
eukprot:COSAG03_NODE_15_length_22165_cov_72.809934_7_plen_983_part_00